MAARWSELKADGGVMFSGWRTASAHSALR